MILLRLFFEFFKVGLFAIGGGLATIPFLSELGASSGWFTQAELADMIAISESTPGPIGVNMASNVGYHMAGIPGVICATFGLAAPSVIVVLIVIGIIEKYKENKTVKGLFYGIRPASMALITAAAAAIAQISLVDFGRISESFGAIFNFKSIILAVIVFILMRKTKIHPILFVFASAAVGIIFNFAP